MHINNFKNSFTYNLMTKMMVFSPKRIGYISDFCNWNEYEDEMIDQLLIKAEELQLEPTLFVMTKDEFSNGLFNKENIEYRAHQKSEKLHVVFYVINEMILKTSEPKNIVKNLQNMMGLEWVFVSHNYQDPVLPFMNEKFFEENWKDKVVFCGNYATKADNSKAITFLNDGEFDLFSDLTTTEYQFSGRVVEGKKLGRTIGYPTANVVISSENPLSYGVYAVELTINQIGEVFMGMGCYWKNELDQNIFETNIFGFDEEIYGRRLTIRPVQKIRDNKKVNGVDDLKALLKKDEEIIREFFQL